MSKVSYENHIQHLKQILNNFYFKSNLLDSLFWNLNTCKGNYNFGSETENQGELLKCSNANWRLHSQLVAWCYSQNVFCTCPSQQSIPVDHHWAAKRRKKKISNSGSVALVLSEAPKENSSCKCHVDCPWCLHTDTSPMHFPSSLSISVLLNASPALTYTLLLSHTYIWDNTLLTSARRLFSI